MLIEKRLPLTYVFKKIGFDVAFVIGVSVLVEVLYYSFERFLPRIPSAVAAFLGTAISLILSFKLAQSYGRWWEARPNDLLP